MLNAQWIQSMFINRSFFFFGFDMQVVHFLNLQNKWETKTNLSFVSDQLKIVKNVYLFPTILKMTKECVKNQKLT